MSDISMRVEGIEKTFPGVKALTNINFTVRKGTVHALCGENGAGKTTLMKIVMGLFTLDKGKIYIDEKPVEIKNPMQAMKLGISMIPQELNYVPELTIEENLFLGRLPLTTFGRVDWKKVRSETKKFLAEQNLAYEPTQQLKTLTVSDIQMLEIIKAITNNAKVIIMDEPTSSITNREVDILFKKINELKSQGVSIVYISHKMDEVFKIADDITVLRDGCVVSTDRASDIDIDTVISRMVGRKLDNIYPKEEVPIGEKFLEVENFGQRKMYEDVSFYAREGEIVGFAGLAGAGRTEVMRAVFGLDKHDTGTVKIKGKKVKINSPSDSIKNKLTMLQENRRENGIVPVRSVKENASLACLKKFIYGGYTHFKEETKKVKESFESMRVKTPTLETPISSLSGGNQQKILLSRWMLCEPDIMILDEPTRGIDVGAKFEIYKLMTDIVKQHKSIIMVSSELPELLGMCDRIYVMCAGHLVTCLDRKDFSQETIMHYATGVMS